MTETPAFGYGRLYGLVAIRRLESMNNVDQMTLAEGRVARVYLSSTWHDRCPHYG